MKNNDRIRTELVKMIKDHSIQAAIDSVGGDKNFEYIMNIKDPIDYLNLFNDIPYITIDSFLYFRYTESSPSKMIYYIKPQILMIGINDFGWLSHSLIYDWFKDNFNLPVREVLLLATTI